MFLFKFIVILGRLICYSLHSDTGNNTFVVGEVYTFTSTVELYIADTIGEVRFGRYRGVVFVEGVIVHMISIRTQASGRYIAGGCSSGVAVKRGSSICTCSIKSYVLKYLTRIRRVSELRTFFSLWTKYAV